MSTSATYPEHHFAIVQALLREGRFLLTGEEAFISLQEHQAFYHSFFWESFRYRLVLQAEYALLISSRDTDTIARDVCIFLGILCYELDRENRNILEELAHATFAIEELEQRFRASSKYEIMELSAQLGTEDKRATFYRRLQRLHLIQWIDQHSFRFTPAHQYFLEFARQLSDQADLREEEE